MRTNTWRWLTGFLSARREGAFTLLICAAFLSVPSCGAAPAYLTAADGSKYVFNPETGQNVKVGSWDHDKKGNVIDRKGDTEGAEGAPKEESPKPDPAQGIYHAASMIGWAGGLLLLLSIVGVVVSFFVPIVPRASAVKGFAVALALFVVQYWVAAYGVTFSIVTFWLGLAAGIVALLAVAYPWFSALFHKRMADEVKTLAAKGDAHGAAAVEIAANPKKYQAPGAKERLRSAIALAGLGAQKTEADH